ncbi:hypothetical protein KIPB_013467, partial [Kipferlia bialata]
VCVPLRGIAQYTPLEISLAVNQMDLGRPEDCTSQIIVGTPGTIQKFFKNLDLRNVRVCVIDEADKMMERSMATQVKRILSACSRSARERPQVLLFSATFNQATKSNIAAWAPGANQLFVEKDTDIIPKGIRHFYIDCRARADGKETRLGTLSELYKLMSVGKSLVFVNTVDSCIGLADWVVGQGHATSAMHGKLDVADRDRTLDDYRRGRTTVLVATDMLSR